MRQACGIACLLAFLAFSLAALAAEAPPKTVESEYPGLSSGPLRMARLVALPKGVLLQAGALAVTEKQLAGEIAAYEPGLQAQLKKQAFFLLEQVAIKPLLLAEARAWAASEKRPGDEPDDAVLQAYLRSIADRAAVTEEEIQASYEENKDALGGLEFADVEDDLREFLLEDKREQLVDAHIQDVSARMPVEVDAAWLKLQAALALDNPVDRLRQAGKPSIIDFSADDCGFCKMMEPILHELQQTLVNRCEILVVDVRQEKVLSARYGVQGIPVQVFIDKEGREVYRHVGFFSREQILAKLAEIGVVK